MNPAAFVLIAVVLGIVVLVVLGGVVLLVVVVVIVGRGVEARDCWDEDGPNDDDDEVDEFAKVFIFMVMMTDPSGDASALTTALLNLDWCAKSISMRM